MTEPVGRCEATGQGPDLREIVKAWMDKADALRQAATDTGERLVQAGRCDAFAQVFDLTTEAATVHESLRRGVGALVATSRCYRRPESKRDPDPGPCGTCAACLAKKAYYGDAWGDS